MPKLFEVNPDLKTQEQRNIAAAKSVARSSACEGIIVTEEHLKNHLDRVWKSKKRNDYGNNYQLV